MRFFVRHANDGAVSGSRPYATLHRRPVQKEKFQTTFKLEIFLESGDVVDVGEVKIMQIGMDEGAVSLPHSFSELAYNYASLGQHYTYYDELVHSAPEHTLEILGALRDLAIDPGRASELAEDEVVLDSLLRSQSAERALVDARDLLDGLNQTSDSIVVTESAVVRQTGAEFSFRTTLGGDPMVADFKFSEEDALPARMIGIIGYNGVGKTRLLANLAMVAQANRSEREEPSYTRYGKFDGEGPPFGSVIAISFSAFDTFDLPRPGKAEDSVYTYCGLRDASRPSTERRLKGSDGIRLDFLNALDGARSEGRREILSGILTTLGREPSFSGFSLDTFYSEGDDQGDEGLLAQFDRMSTGHKIILNIVVQLVASLQLRSLVLFDEPESHLHPPLLAALMRAVSRALELRESWAIVATHSPVVIQELPARYVKVLRREGRLNWLEDPEVETFGENVGRLTSTVFSLDSTTTDYHAVLTKLANELSLEQIEALFDDQMAAPAKAYVASLLRRRRTA